MFHSASSRAAALIVVLLLVPFVLVSCGGGGQTPSARAWGGPEAIVRANCSSCHGPTLEGGVSWIDPAWQAPPIAGYPTIAITVTVRDGRPHMMPSMPKQEISDAALEELGSYVYGLPGGAVPDPPYDVTVTVLDEDPWFDPPQVKIKPGATVRFVNGGRTYHPVVELENLMTMGAQGTSSRNLGPGGAWFRTFDQRGDYTFLCGMHPYMRGEIHVGTEFSPPVYGPDTPAPAPAVPGVGEVWVLAQFQDWPGRSKDGVIQVIDAATWTVTHQFPVGNNPHNIWFGHGGHEAVVTSWFDTFVSLIDADTKTVVADYFVGPSPAHVTSDYAGTNWYITMEGTHFVQAHTQEAGWAGLQGFMPAAQKAWLTGYGPHGIWYTNGLLAIANSMDCTFSIVDAVTMTEVASLPAGLLPLGAGADSTGTIAAAGNYGGSVSIYDLQGRAHVRDIPVPGGAIQVPFTPDNQKIVASNGTFVTVIDAAKAADVSGFPDPASAIDATIWTGKGAHGVAFGPKAGGGTYAYVSHKFENYVSVIDLATLTKAGDVPLLLTTTGKVSLAGSTDTGGNGIAVRPSPPPWQ